MAERPMYPPEKNKIPQKRFDWHLLSLYIHAVFCFALIYASCYMSTIESLNWAIFGNCLLTLIVVSHLIFRVAHRHDRWYEYTK